MRQIILLVVALVAGLIAFFGSSNYIKRKEKELIDKFKMVEVVVAKKDIPAGTALTFDMLDHRTMVESAATYLAVRYDKRVLELEGKRTQRYIQKDSPIFWADLEGMYPMENTLSSLIPVGERKTDALTGKSIETIGMRAISIPVDLVGSVTQMVMPGDHVDIIATFAFPSSKPDPTLDTVTLTILQDVYVVAVGKTTTRDMPGLALYAQQSRTGLAQAYSTVTLLVSPEEAEMLAFAIRRGGGNLMLSLRNREDPTVTWKPQSINFDYLQKNLHKYHIMHMRRMHPPRTPPDEER